VIQRLDAAAADIGTNRAAIIRTLLGLVIFAVITLVSWLARLF